MQMRKMQGYRKAVYGGPPWWQRLIKVYLLQDCVTVKKSSTDFFVVVVGFKMSKEPLSHCIPQQDNLQHLHQSKWSLSNFTDLPTDKSGSSLTV